VWRWREGRDFLIIIESKTPNIGHGKGPENPGILKS